MLCRHRADDDSVSVNPDALEVGDAAEIDQMLRCREPCFHDGDETVPTCEWSCFVAKLGKKSDRLLGGIWTVIIEPAWDHGMASSGVSSNDHLLPDD